MNWIKAIPGAVYDQSVEVIARYPKAAFWVLVGSAGFGVVGWMV